MHAALAKHVHPVLARGLDLLDRLERGESPALDEEQAALVGLLGTAGLPDFDGEPGRNFLGARYALVCWLDELFIVDSPWSGPWNEQKLEARLYDSNDRAWRFWEQAQVAAARPTRDVLEVFFLCVLLGFSGERIDDPASLSGWVAATRLQLSQARDVAWQAPPGIEPTTFVPRLEGRGRLRTLLLVACAVVLAVVPAVALLLARRLG